MSDKLSSKPIQEPLWGWKELDDILQSNFKIADKNNLPSATIDTSKFEMSKEEIISESEKKGYKVTDVGVDHLQFN